MVDGADPGPRRRHSTLYLVPVHYLVLASVSLHPPPPTEAKQGTGGIPPRWPRFHECPSPSAGRHWIKAFTPSSLKGRERSELSEGRKFTQCSGGKTRMRIKLSIGKQFWGPRTPLFPFHPPPHLISEPTASLVMTVVMATGPPSARGAPGAYGSDVTSCTQRGALYQ